MYIENNQIKNYITIWLFFMFWIISIMIVIGGLTRLTDSGLSITTWELFTGFLPPLNESDWFIYFDLYKKIPEYRLQNYSMSISEFKVIFWWEWTHRLLGRFIGISFILPLLFFSFKVGFRKLKFLYLIFLLICFQGFVGWYMVTSGLIERVNVSHYRLSLHLIIAFIILSMILWTYLSLRKQNINKFILKPNLPLFFLFLIYIQIVIGAFVAGMDGGKIYNTWPLMNNNYFPDDNNFFNLFELKVFDDPSLVQFIHRNLAYFIFLFYLTILFKIYKNKLTNLYIPIKIIGLFVCLQIILGILTLLFGAQIFIASMHQISSIFLVSSCVYLLFYNKRTNLQL